MVRVVATPEAITPEWLTEVLSPTTDARVVDVERTPVGTGQMGDSVRLALTYDPPGAGPASLVAKLPATDPTSRATAATMRSYEIEVSFYRELAPTLPVRAPKSYAALHDPATHDFVLLLEDVAPARQGDQLTGCSLAHAEIAVDELVNLHAPRWGDPTLTTIPWLHRSRPDQASASAVLLGMLYDGFRSRYADRLDPDVAALCERFIPRLAAHLADRSAPWTVVHGDYRLDNLLFGTSEGGPPVAVVDWQTVTVGPGISDLSYFIGAGLVTDDRRVHERDLVARYAAAMRHAGVDLDDERCFTEYRRHSFAGLIMAIGASMIVVQTDRGDDMFMAMANRHGRHALDLDAEALLPS